MTFYVFFTRSLLPRKLLVNHAKLAPLLWADCVSHYWLCTAVRVEFVATKAAVSLSLWILSPWNPFIYLKLASSTQHAWVDTSARKEPALRWRRNLMPFNYPCKTCHNPKSPAAVQPLISAYNDFCSQGVGVRIINEPVSVSAARICSYSPSSSDRLIDREAFFHFSGWCVT